MTNLALCSVGSNDYSEIDDGYPVVTSVTAAERTNEVWTLERNHSLAALGAGLDRVAAWRTSDVRHSINQWPIEICSFLARAHRYYCGNGR
jgi:hypothetical protein